MRALERSMLNKMVLNALRSVYIHFIFYNAPLSTCVGMKVYTGGIERFSARKNFSKILQVSHFHLGFSTGKNNHEIIYSHRVSWRFWTQVLKTLMKPYQTMKILMKLYGKF